jgi:hypothetical protein
MTLPLKSTEDASPMPLRDLMNRVGTEMEELAGAVHKIQSLVSLLLREDAFNNSANLHEMQSLDLIAQKIEGIGEFLAGLSQDLPATWEVDAHEASQVILLSDLAARLLGEDKPAPAATSGDFEAF